MKRGYEEEWGVDTAIETVKRMPVVALYVSLIVSDAESSAGIRRF